MRHFMAERKNKNKIEVTFIVTELLKKEKIKKMSILIEKQKVIWKYKGSPATWIFCIYYSPVNNCKEYMIEVVKRQDETKAEVDIHQMGKIKFYKLFKMIKRFDPNYIIKTDFVLKEEDITYDFMITTSGEIYKWVIYIKDFIVSEFSGSDRKKEVEKELKKIKEILYNS